MDEVRLTPRDVAKMVGVSDTHVRREMIEGRLKHVKVGSHRRTCAAWVREWWSRCTVGTQN